MNERASEREVRVLKAHLALNVRSVGESVEFYRKMLSLEPVRRRAGYAKFDVENPPLNLTLNERAAARLNERATARAGALSHLGLQVSSTADVLALKRRWAEAGLTTADEMQTDCCYALQDKTWVSDPDGNEWEAFVVLEENLAGTMTCCVTEQKTAGEQAADSCCGSEVATRPLPLSR